MAVHCVSHHGHSLLIRHLLQHYDHLSLVALTGVMYLSRSRRLAQAEAERRLIMAALKNLRNQRLILLSESCAPLYPPQLIYTQLLGEPRSRVNVCSQPELLDERWAPGLLWGCCGQVAPACWLAPSHHLLFCPHSPPSLLCPCPSVSSTSRTSPSCQL